MMPRVLRIFLLITDIGFILYWGFTAFVSVHLISVPSEWLFKDYGDTNIIAWNWSFMPLDLLASITGLFAIWQSKTNAAWQGTALISLILTFCAGFMALSFWTFQGSFDLAWWSPNIFLMLWPLFMLPLVRTKP
jgi:Family of unknown function (DUF5360)